MSANDVIEKYRAGQAIFRRQSVELLIMEIWDLRRQLEEVIGQRDLAINLAFVASEIAPLTEDDKQTIRDLKKKWKGEV